MIETGTKDSFHNSATVELTILNENDNSPSFNQPSYEANVPENSPRNFAVMALQVILYAAFLSANYLSIFIALVVRVKTKLMT